MTAADDRYTHYYDAWDRSERLIAASDILIAEASEDENVGAASVRRVAVMKRCVLAHHNATPWWRA